MTSSSASQNIAYVQSTGRYCLTLRTNTVHYAVSSTTPHLPNYQLPPPRKIYQNVPQWGAMSHISFHSPQTPSTNPIFSPPPLPLRALGTSKWYLRGAVHSPSTPRNSWTFPPFSRPLPLPIQYDLHPEKVGLRLAHSPTPLRRDPYVAQIAHRHRDETLA